MEKRPQAASHTRLVGNQQKAVQTLNLAPHPAMPLPRHPPVQSRLEALVLIMKCSAKSNVNKLHAQLTWQQSSPARNAAAAFNSAGLGTNLQERPEQPGNCKGRRWYLLCFPQVPGETHCSAPGGLLKGWPGHLLQDVFKFLGSFGWHEKWSRAANPLTCLKAPHKGLQHLRLIFTSEN